jgi:hypothetical protein
MSPPPPAIQDLARRLLASEPARVESPHGDADQAVLACERLRVPLTKLIGAAGFASLLSRALALARRQAPPLEGLRVGADGLLTGFNEVQQDSGAAEAARHWGAVLVAELLGLLVTFIGQPLTLSLVREAWPDASVETMTLTKEEIA